MVKSQGHCPPTFVERGLITRAVANDIIMQNRATLLKKHVVSVSLQLLTRRENGDLFASARSLRLSRHGIAATTTTRDTSFIKNIGALTFNMFHVCY